jgi:hypothetical protein
MSLSDPLRVTRKLVSVLDDLGIPYLVGGSLASSLYGVPRATQDVDVVVDEVDCERLTRLAEVLKEDFFVDEEMMRKALADRRAFNVIDREELFKVDIFFRGTDEASRLEMDRRRRFSFPEENEGDIYLCTPEDIIVHKLYWYKLGDGVSDRQWNDALNVIKVQSKALDMSYLHRVAQMRGVEDHLQKALMAIQRREPR